MRVRRIHATVSYFFGFPGNMLFRAQCINSILEEACNTILGLFAKIEGTLSCFGLGSGENGCEKFLC